METKTYNNITYSYNSRTKRYKFITNHTDDFIKALKLLIGKSSTNLLFVKPTKSSFEFHDFFLLELHYLLKLIVTEEHYLGLDIGGVLLQDFIALLETKTWLSERYINTSNTFDYKRITKTMKYHPLEHQYPLFAKYATMKVLGALRGGLADAQAGSGKTYTSLALGEMLEYETIIILAPKNTIEQVWVDSVTTVLFKKPQSYVVLTGKAKHTNEKYIITNYEYLEKLMRDKKELRKLKRLKPMLIIDEYHNYNELKSLRTETLLDFVNYIDFKDMLYLTGTPIKMKVKELQPLLYLLDTKFYKIKDIFEQFYRNLNFTKIDLLQYRFNLYRERVVTSAENKGEIEIEEYRLALSNGNDYTLSTITTKMEDYKYTRLIELHDNMEKYQYDFNVILEEVRRNLIKGNSSNLEEVKKLIEYKTLVKTIRAKSDKNSLHEVYDKVTLATSIEKEVILPNLSPLDKIKFKEVKSIVKYPKLKVLGEALGKILLGTRIRCYKDLARNLDYTSLLKLTNKKGLVFSNYIGVCEVVTSETRNEGFKPIGVYGEHVTNLTKHVEEFNDLSNETSPMVATYKALSTGNPLTAANVVILIDNPLRSYIIEQSIARAYRIGNDEKVLVFLVKLDTGDEFNITDRDLFIVNTSESNVETITGNKPSFNIPKQELISDMENDEDILTDDSELVMKDIIGESILSVVKDVKSPLTVVETFLKNIFIK